MDQFRECICLGLISALNLMYIRHFSTTINSHLDNILVGKLKVDKQYSCGDLVFDIEKMTITKDRAERALNYNECLLFKAFLESSNQVLSKETLKQAGWPETIVTDSSLQKSVQKLRLAIAMSESVELRTIAGVGYMLYCDNASLEAKPSGAQRFNATKLAKILLASVSIVLIVLSCLNFLRVTNTHLMPYLHEDYEVVDIGSHELLKRKDMIISPDIEAVIKRFECDCFYFIGEKAGLYNLSVYDKKRHHSENYFFEIEALPEITEGLFNDE